MVTILSILTAAVIAQADPAYPIHHAYTLILYDGQTLHVLLEQDDLTEARRVYIDVIRDEPWLPLSERDMRIRQGDIEDKEPAMSAVRERRIRAGWEANGGVEVDTPNGKRWVHGDDYALAQRARSIANEAYRVFEEPQRVQPSRSVESAAQTAPGFWAQWGYHITIITGAIALIASVAWVMMIQGPSTTLKS